LEEFDAGKAFESTRRWKRKSRERSSLGCGGSSRLLAYGGDATRHHLAEIRNRERQAEKPLI
jgi:hypothetical protein